MANNNSKTIISSLKRKTFSASVLAGKQQYQIHPKYLSGLSELELYQALDETDIEELGLTSKSLKNLYLRDGVGTFETMKKVFQINFEKLKHFRISRWQFPDWTVFDERPEIKELSTKVEYDGVLEVRSKYIENLDLYLEKLHPIADFSHCTSLKTLRLSIKPGNANSVFPAEIILPKKLEQLTLCNDSSEKLDLSKFAFPSGISELKRLVLDCEIEQGGIVPKFNLVDHVSVKAKYFSILTDIAPNAQVVQVLDLEKFQCNSVIAPMVKIKRIEGSLLDNQSICGFFPNTEEIHVEYIFSNDLIMFLKGFTKLRRVRIDDAVSVRDQLENLHKQIPGIDISATVRKSLGNFEVEVSDFKYGVWNTYNYITR